jgi:hypothetical protein
MNEKIKELAEQAAEYAAQNATGDWEVGPAYQDLFNKKFAELIVRECAQVAEEVDGDSRARKCVLEHFGVES